MAVDPFVPASIEDAPQLKERVPPARGWTARRPGDLPPERPRGHLFGTPGPDAGYALTLAERLRPRLDLAWAEHPDDALTVATAIGMKRAGEFGRAPVLADIELGLTVLGYLGGAPEDLIEWRREHVREARHSYPVQRALADMVPTETLGLTPPLARDRLRHWRTLFRTTT
jgi:hypothetical protein